MHLRAEGLSGSRRPGNRLVTHVRARGAGGRRPAPGRPRRGGCVPRHQSVDHRPRGRHPPDGTLDARAAIPSRRPHAGPQPAGGFSSVVAGEKVSICGETTTSSGRVESYVPDRPHGADCGPSTPLAARVRLGCSSRSELRRVPSGAAPPRSCGWGPRADPPPRRPTRAARPGPPGACARCPA
jgi:hypothetical protein